MKTKGGIYFIPIILGIVIMTFGEKYILREYALSLGFILLMFGLYKVSRSWRKNDSAEEENI